MPFSILNNSCVLYFHAPADNHQLHAMPSFQTTDMYLFAASILLFLGGMMLGFYSARKFPSAAILVILGQFFLLFVAAFPFVIWPTMITGSLGLCLRFFGVLGDALVVGAVFLDRNTGKKIMAESNNPSGIPETKTSAPSSQPLIKRFLLKPII